MRKQLSKSEDAALYIQRVYRGRLKANSMKWEKNPNKYPKAVIEAYKKYEGK